MQIYMEVALVVGTSWVKLAVLQSGRTRNSQEPVQNETDRWRIARQAKPTTGTGFGGFGTSTTPNPFTTSQVNTPLVLRSVPGVV